MLNELFELSRSLDAAGLKVVSWHKFFRNVLGAHHSLLTSMPIRGSRMFG